MLTATELLTDEIVANLTTALDAADIAWKVAMAAQDAMRDLAPALTISSRVMVGRAARMEAFAAIAAARPDLENDIVLSWGGTDERHLKAAIRCLRNSA